MRKEKKRQKRVWLSGGCICVMSDKSGHSYQWYIQYEYPDGRVVRIAEADPRKGLTNTMIGGAAFLALGLGVGAAIGVRMSAGKEKTVPISTMSLRLALKAFTYGTLIAWSGAALAVVVTAKVMGVSSIKEFGDRMRIKVPEKTAHVPEYVGPLRDFLGKHVASIVGRRSPSLDDIPPERMEKMLKHWNEMFKKKNKD